MSQQHWIQKHWEVFKRLDPVDQGPVGTAPAAWAERFGVEIVRNAGSGGPSLSTNRLDRSQVRELCRDPDNDVWFGYVNAMAWGDQGKRFPANAERAIEHRRAIETLLLKLRHDKPDRAAAYELFRAAAVPGLGPSFYTKLLYFFDARKPARCYIMDQWTAKSVNLLAGRTVVKLDNGTPSPRNTGETYEAFCTEVDKLASCLTSEIGPVSGEQVEERLFSSGGSGKRLGAWRKHVRELWGKGDDSGAGR